MTTASPCISRASIQTEKAAGYLIQLCKHFGHKTEATYADNKGRIVFEAGVCDLDAMDAGVLAATITAQGEDQRTIVEGVIQRHLVRFAFKEELQFQWIPQT